VSLPPHDTEIVAAAAKNAKSLIDFIDRDFIKIIVVSVCTAVLQ
jgi:hypothetical protein